MFFTIFEKMVGRWWLEVGELKVGGKMSDVVLLRTLTLKSYLGFGKWPDLSIRNILDCKGIAANKYLVWLYYRASRISFNEEILKRLGIYDKIKINKPGKISEKELSNYLSKATDNRMLEYNKMSQEDKYRANGMARKEYFYKKRQEKGRQIVIKNKLQSKGLLKNMQEYKKYNRCPPPIN